MNTTTGEINDLRDLFNGLTNSGLSEDAAKRKLEEQISAGKLHMIEQGLMTRKQFEEKQVSKHDNKSPLGKKFTNCRREQRKINLGRD